LGNLELDRQAMEERRDIAFAIAISHPKVKEIVGDAQNYAPDIHLLDNNLDRVTITTYKDIRITSLDGNFTNGYVINFDQRKMIQVDIDRKTNSVLSVKIDELPSVSDKLAFNDNQKEIINTVLAFNEVKKLVDGKDFFIQQVRETGVGYSTSICPEYGCALVGFSLVDSGEGVLMTVIVNPITSEVFDIRTGEGWNLG